MADPNPKVSGLGFEKLRAAGVQVEVGRLEELARRLNESFARYIRHGTPLVTLKSAMTLDGKIAPPPEPVNQLTSPDRDVTLWPGFLRKLDYRRSRTRACARTAAPE